MRRSNASTQTQYIPLTALINKPPAGEAIGIESDPFLLACNNILESFRRIERDVHCALGLNSLGEGHNRPGGGDGGLPSISTERITLLEDHTRFRAGAVVSRVVKAAQESAIRELTKVSYLLPAYSDSEAVAETARVRLQRPLNTKSYESPPVRTVFFAPVSPNSVKGTGHRSSPTPLEFVEVEETATPSPRYDREVGDERVPPQDPSLVGAQSGRGGKPKRELNAYESLEERPCHPRAAVYGPREIQELTYEDRNPAFAGRHDDRTAQRTENGLERAPRATTTATTTIAESPSFPKYGEGIATPDLPSAIRSKPSPERSQILSSSGGVPSAPAPHHQRPTAASGSGTTGISGPGGTSPDRRPDVASSSAVRTLLGERLEEGEIPVGPGTHYAMSRSPRLQTTRARHYALQFEQIMARSFQHVSTPAPADHEEPEGALL